MKVAQVNHANKLVIMKHWAFHKMASNMEDSGFEKVPNFTMVKYTKKMPFNE